MRIFRPHRWTKDLGLPAEALCMDAAAAEVVRKALVFLHTRAVSAFVRAKIQPSGSILEEETFFARHSGGDQLGGAFGRELLPGRG